MPEPVSKDLLTKSNQLTHYKEAVLEKDVLVKNHLGRIKELENEVGELKAKQSDMEHKMQATNLEDDEFNKIMVAYDDFISKIWEERHNLIAENKVLEKHVENLETTFQKLVERYEQSRVIIEKLVRRESELNKEIEESKISMEEMKTKLEEMKQHSESLIAEANLKMDNREKGNIQEVAKLKAKILQSEAKINELQKHVKVENICTRLSIFEPLRNNIPKHF